MIAAASLSLQRFLSGLATLARFERGTATFVVGDEGEFIHEETVVTIKLGHGESLEAFHQRLRRDHGLQKGDRIEILNNGGHCDTARLSLRPRAA